jgi:hypothetical protein
MRHNGKPSKKKKPEFQVAIFTRGDKGQNIEIRVYGTFRPFNPINGKLVDFNEVIDHLKTKGWAMQGSVILVRPFVARALSGGLRGEGVRMRFLQLLQEIIWNVVKVVT